MTTSVCSPVLETSTIKYSIQPGCGWLDKRYYPGTNQAHTGVDLNDVRGRDSDLGNLVRSVADGTVIDAGDFPNWGGIVLVYHPELEVYTQYAHLYGITVRAGQTVRMGDRLGQIGKGEKNQFWAHLHFEVRRSKLAANFWPSNHAETRAEAAKFIREHYLDPAQWLEQQEAIRSYDEVMAAIKVRDTPPAPVPIPVPAIPPGPQPSKRLLVEQGGRWEDMTGKQFKYGPVRGTVVINDSEEGKLWIRVE